MSGSLIDASVWVASVFPPHTAHSLAHAALAQATPGKPALFCRATQQSFFRLITTPALLRAYAATEFNNRTALVQYQMILNRPTVCEVAEPPGTTALWRQLAARDTASPKVWMDAYLAAFAITGGFELTTFDRDFQTYQPQGLRLRLLA